MLGQTPHYELTAPLFISARLMPAVRIGDGTVSVEAHGLEPDGRAHFRFHIDVPGVGTWSSTDSYVTTMKSTWTESAVTALETFCDSVADVWAEDMPADAMSVWVMASEDEFALMAHDLQGE